MILVMFFVLTALATFYKFILAIVRNDRPGNDDCRLYRTTQTVKSLKFPENFESIKPHNPFIQYSEERLHAELMRSRGLLKTLGVPWSITQRLNGFAT